MPVRVPPALILRSNVAAMGKGCADGTAIQSVITCITPVQLVEVLHIFAGVVVIGTPVMRILLLILFLILDTDLPPPIALGILVCVSF